MIYQWRESARLPGDAQAVGEELERIRQHDGGDLSPEAVVNASRLNNAVLYSYFEWDDATAAHEHRLQQARHLIGSVEVVIEAPTPSRPVRAFVSVVRDTGRAYRSVSDALADPDLRQQVLSQALSELEAWRSRYAELVELAKVFAAIDQARSAK